MNVFITGINGFVGRRLARAFAAAGDRVAGSFLGALPADLAPFEERLVRLDLADASGLRAALATADPEVVIHLAGLAHVGSSWGRQEEYREVNVEGTRRLLAAASGRRVIFASSAEVYGAVPDDEQPVPEDRPLAPQSPYACTKAEAEALVLAAEPPAVVARSFNAIGPGQAPTFALPAFARQLAAIRRGEGEAVLRVGNLSPRRDFLHVDDVAEGYVLLARRGEGGGAYNLCSGKAATIAEMLDLLMEISGVEARVETDPAKVREVDFPLLVGDASRLRALGWAPHRGRRRALADLWRETLAETGAENTGEASS